MPVAPTTPVELLDLVRKSGVTSPERLSALDVDTLPADIKKTSALLIQKGIITKFQAQQLLQGRHKGFRLGAYAILDQLGRGGMGAVYLAEHSELRRKVAIKVLVSGKDDDQKLAQERFLREARAAAALDHPNIVRIFDVCRHGDVPYLVMEYVEGSTIQQILDRDGTVPYTTAADYIAQAAAGLQHAHEKGFVHRDIKPGNMILEKSGTLKILDMGLARQNDSAKDRITEQLDAGAVVGTADFIAPEQALNNVPVDIRADIYSLGASFFTMIIGKPPFEGNTAQKLLQHQMTAAPQLSKLDATLPKGLVGVVAKMLAKKPEDRFQTPADIIGGLAPWLGNSSRILAGLSRTNLAIGAELHATLNELARRSSTRLGVADVERPTGGNGQDSGEVRPGSPMSKTGEIATAETTREPIRKKKSLSTKSKVTKQIVTFAAGVALLATVGLVASLAFGGRKDENKSAPNPDKDSVKGSDVLELPGDPNRATPPQTNPNPPPNPNPQPAPKKDTNPKPSDDPILYRVDLGTQKPFNIRSSVEMNNATPPAKVARELSRVGPGNPPKDWSGRCYDLKSEMEFFAEAAPGGPALGIRNVVGPGSAMLFMPTFTAPTQVVRLRFEYCTNVRGGKFVLRFKPTSPSQAAWTVNPINPTGDVWRVEEMVIDLKGATAGFFEFHNTDENPATAVKIRNVTVWQAPAGSAPPPPPTPAPAPAGPDYSRWNEKAQIYKFDATSITPFRVTKQGGKATAGTSEMLPPGVSAKCWKAEATGEFRREEVEGFAALGQTNFSEEKSAQFAFELEKDVKLNLKSGAYRVKLNYLTKNDAVGGLTIQTQDYKNVASTRLNNTGGLWKTTTLNFERKDAVPVRLTIDNTSVGEGNTLYFRSVEIVELEPPLMK